MSDQPGVGTRVLIIDDDHKLNDLLTEYLTSFGFDVRTATHPEAGLRTVVTDPPDLVILDVMLPGMDGLAVCRKVRETSRLPVIMLTARGDVADRVLGLELGADDYLAKPFEPRELVARIQAVLRRSLDQDPELTQAGGLTVDWSARAVSLHGRALSLTTAEFDLLGLLLRNRRRVLSRERIMEGTHGVNWDAYDRSVDVLVSRLRLKLGDDARQPTFIRTVRGVGYSFVGDDHD